MDPGRLLSLLLRMVVPTLILLLLMIGSLPVEADSHSYNNSRVCMGSNTGLSHASQPWERYLSYIQKYGNCTTIQENLEIVFLDGSNDNYDMSFLESIREVTGYVLIVGNFFDTLPLTNLRLIRGRTLYFKGNNPTKTSVGYSLYISNNYKTNSMDVGLKEVHLKSLHEILDGNVLFQKNNLLCYVETINWKDILGSKLPEIYPLQQGEYRRSCEECHPDCTFNGTARHCWGSGQDMCQTITSLKCSPNCEFRCFGPSPTQCCDGQCAGGCGHNKTNCWACRHFVKDDMCIEQCPGEKVYNIKTYKQELNPDRRYTYGANCVKKCPEHMLIENEACVSKCSEGHISNDDDRKCKPCEKGGCPKTCSGTDDVNGINIGNFSGCTVIDGNLRFLGHLFKGSPDFPGISNISQLDVFESVREITGYLFVQTNYSQFTSLSFLKNLQKVYGRTTYRDSRSVVISYTSLVTLGLTSLREIINGHMTIEKNYELEHLGLVSLKTIRQGSLLIKDNPRLCYIDSINWTQVVVDPTKKIIIKANANQMEWCGPRNETCSAECTVEGGCWGPGDENCRFCVNYRYESTCVRSCDFQKGLYPEDINGTSECRSCHEECLDDCTGKEASNCTACRHVKDGPYCVSECPDLKYLNETTGTCELCFESCHSGCTGPGDFIGMGGCNDCFLVLHLEPKNTQCLPKDSPCPIGYYNSPKKMTIETQNGTRQRVMNSCSKCNAECVKCLEAGTMEEACECRNFAHDSHCVPSCPTYYYNDSSRKCRPCHDECLKCSGPTATDCISCKNVRVYQEESAYGGSALSNFSLNYIDSKNDLVTDETTTDYSNSTNELPKGNFNCTNMCPDWLPHKEKFMIDDSLSQYVCLVEPPKSGDSVGHPSEKAGLSIGLPVVVGVVVIGLITIIVVFLRRQWARSEENKLRIAARMNGLDIEEIVTPTDAKPDLSTLRLIKESELRRGNEIGSGAFGTVYKGIWIPPGENVKIPVAIKVLTESSNSNLNMELLDEARIMASVNNPCCIRILAVCMTAQMMLVTPLMPHGSLLDYLRKNRNSVGSSALLKWSAQIARGMRYLEERGIVHRDLAARNVLVQGPSQVRITDFGLAKLLDHNAEQYQAIGGKMPIKWLALESIQHRIFTHKSDVWSYGVTLWELFTYGQRPYEAIRAVDMANHLEMGERLTQPAICTIDIYMIMIKCWMVDADSRPTFFELEGDFTNMTRDPGRYVVIPGDKFMRLPSVIEDLSPTDWMRSLSLPADEGPEKFVTAEEYLRPQDLEGFHPLDSRFVHKLISIDEEGNEYENSFKRTTSLDTNSTSSPTDQSKFFDLEEAAAAKKLVSPEKGGRKLSFRYTSDPCGDGFTGTTADSSMSPAVSVSNGAGSGKDKLVPDQMEMKCITDETDYLQPRSSLIPHYLDVVEQSEPNSKNAPAIGNPEYFIQLRDEGRLSETAPLIDEQIQRQNSSQDSHKYLGRRNAPTSNEYINMNTKSQPTTNQNFNMETNPNKNHNSGGATYSNV